MSRPRKPLAWLLTGRNRDLTIRIFPTANHGILTTSPAGRPRLAAWYLDLMTK